MSDSLPSQSIAVTPNMTGLSGIRTLIENCHFGKVELFDALGIAADIFSLWPVNLITSNILWIRSLLKQFILADLCHLKSLLHQLVGISKSGRMENNLSIAENPCQTDLVFNAAHPSNNPHLPSSSQPETQPRWSEVAIDKNLCNNLHNYHRINNILKSD